MIGYRYWETDPTSIATSGGVFPRDAAMPLCHLYPSRARRCADYAMKIELAPIRPPNRNMLLYFRPACALTDLAKRRR